MALEERTGPAGQYVTETWMSAPRKEDPRRAVAVQT